MRNHNLKINTGRKLKQYDRKSQDTYLDTYPGNGVLQSTQLKKFILEISIREKSMEEVAVNNNNMIK